MTTATGAKLPGHDQYEKLRKALQSGNRSQIDKILETLVKACQKHAVPVAEKPKLDDDQLNFWLNEILRLLFDWENALTRDLALRASEAIVPHLEQTLYLDSPAWPALKSQISNNYANLLKQARGRNDPEWHRKWSVLVRILDKEICQGALIINVFLAIVENGFRSAELLVREQSFDCWRLLVEIFAKYQQINIPKRIKLICIPLKSSKSKTEVIALKKFEIWWFLINKLQPQLDVFAENVFEPFIYFCFGPSFKTPLCYYFDNSYQEFGAPGKIYDNIKQLSALALIHMLGPAPKITETLLAGTGIGGTSDSQDPDKNGLISFNPPSAAAAEHIISAKLFSQKTKLIINSCTECTVLFSQMKDKNYLELNRCLWRNLMNMVDQEVTTPRADMLGWIRENLAALISLSAQLNDQILRELVYDTVLLVVQSKLLTVVIGQDSPEQLLNNYRTFMTLMFVPDLTYPEETSQKILSHVFDLRRYASSKTGYWDMLQKSFQYLCDLDPALLNESRSDGVRRMVTQIYSVMAGHLEEQIQNKRFQFEHAQTIVYNFLLYPLEYDRFLEVGDVKESWQKVYHMIVKNQKSTRYACSLSEVIKAMTVAKYNANLTVILDFFRTVLETIPGEYDLGHPPVKTLELFKDLIRKALVFQTSLMEVAMGVESFRQLIERFAVKSLLLVIMPIRNVVSELVSGENEKLMEGIQSLLKSLVERFLSTKFTVELKTQPKEVKWNCKMLINMLLELPPSMQKQWKIPELKKLHEVCEGKDGPKTPKSVKKEGDFVVIEKVWKFTPDKLTEHQRDRMRQKRDDIPALYNDLSQSQDSFVIKPWTPNKIVIPADANNDHDTIVMCGNDTSTNTNGGTSEASVPKEQGAATDETIKLDKENNNGNVQENQVVVKPEQGAATTSTENKKPHDRKSKTARELDLLRIDMVQGKNLQAALSVRTRRSGSLEPSSRRKNADPKRIPGSVTKHPPSENRRNTRKVVEKLPAESPARKKSEEKPKSPAERTSPRKSLNFDNVTVKEPAPATEAPKPKSPMKAKAINESVEDIIESSQANSQSLLARKFTPRKPKEDEIAPAAATEETLPFDTEAEKEIAKLSSTSSKSPVKANVPGSVSPSKNTRSAAAAQQQKISEVDTVPNTALADTVPNTEPAPITQIEKPKSPISSKTAKTGKRSTSPVPEPINAEPASKSPKKSTEPEEQELASPNLSPVRNLDEQMEPLTRSLNRSLVSSPEGVEREADLLNSTLNISPISEDKGHHSTTPSTDPNKESATGSGEKRASNRIMDREKPSVMPSPIGRRTRNSPPMIPAALANLKARTPQMAPRSPSTGKIELRGRGAQLINLIRNQRNEGSPKPGSGPSPQNSSTPKQMLLPSTPGSERSLMMRKLATTGNITTSQSPEQTKPLLPEKEKDKDYLVFSKVLPSPQASPAASILKRKLNHDDSGDDIDSPANKRKRVSFHDPPVSLTKEYIRQEEECRSPSINRCLQMAGMSPADKAKFLLRRKSKADSLSELVKFTRTADPMAPGKEEEDQLSSSPDSIDGEFGMINTTDNMSSLQVTTESVADVEMKECPEPTPVKVLIPTEKPTETTDTVTELPKRTSPRKISPKPAIEEPAQKPTSPIPASPAPKLGSPSAEKLDNSIRFQTEDEILSHVISKYSLDNILERYLTAGKTLEHQKTTRLLTRELSTLMTKDSKTRYTVLDELCDRHSAEFLDHAVQENSSAAVCQRLSMVTMVENIFERLTKIPPEGGTLEEQEERIKILQTMFEQLAEMHKFVRGSEFDRMRESFVKKLVYSKSKFEVMELLEEYFSRTKGETSS
ncbi:telomere-associated protein RIF1 isoform X2 [Uranotaenia lowii]|nr:telomere-associated protein RIF1 isoform X2 [Uranotaenia lowii]XP_055600358.1 telomere-associated protein RIF1 isoform X2 [Uranotaenia lowii]